jgi:hypothetical protein
MVLLDYRDGAFVSVGVHVLHVWQFFEVTEVWLAI